MSVSIALLDEYINTFSGNDSGFGVHVYGKMVDGQKEVDGKSFTKNEIITEKLYEEHLNGVKGLGISPIDSTSKCLFGVIDVDIYNNSYNYLVEMIYKNNLPLFPFRSKSGGLHLYLFMVGLVKATELVSVLKSFCVLLGLPSTTEIFPKQTKIKEGIGNWINLPYYDHEDPRSYLIDPTGNCTPLRIALEKISENKVTIVKCKDILEALELSDAPPCMQHIYLRGETTSRNEYLFSLARYYKTKFGDDFEFHLTTANNNLKQPIKIDELQKSIIASHQKREYTYKCGSDPLLSHCNKGICKLRKFGIGGDEISELTFGDFTQFLTDPPYYEWCVNEKSLKFFDEFDIMRQDFFRKLCVRQLHIMPVKLKDLNWTKIVNNALSNIITKDINSEDDISPGAMFKEYLTEFLENRATAANKEQILFDRVFKDEEKEQYVFKSKNLIIFLVNQKQFRAYGQVELQDKLKQLGGEPKRYYISKKHRNIRVWTLPFNSLNKFIEEKNIDEFEVDFLEDYTNQEAF